VLSIAGVAAIMLIAILILLIFARSKIRKWLGPLTTMGTSP
jgi:Sec-independent protein translocase protein TatA